MEQKRFGHFYELDQNDMPVEISRLRRIEAEDDEQLVIQYLESGKVSAVVMIIERDFADSPNGKSLGEVILRTDGEWTWPESLCYYIKRYHIRVPEEFRQKMASTNWLVPRDFEPSHSLPPGQIQM